VRLIRDGKEPTKYHRNDIVVGDIVMIDSGINVPVDGIVLESIGVKLDESAMTGESDHFPKEPLEKCLKLKADYLED
jgi:P-type E1-E2 ATPase